MTDHLGHGERSDFIVGIERQSARLDLWVQAETGEQAKSAAQLAVSRLLAASGPVTVDEIAINMGVD